MVYRNMVMNVIISKNLKVSYPDIRILKSNGNILTAAIQAKNLNFLEKGQEVTFIDKLDQGETDRGHILNVKKNKNGLILEIAKTI